MTGVLFIGLIPAAVDFSDPAIPAGTTREQIAAGIEEALGDMRRRGWQAEFCGILPDASAEATIADWLRKARWDCIVIGAGVRMPTRNHELLERVVNAVHRGAPQTPIAFNRRPEDTTAAAARWLKPD